MKKIILFLVITLGLLPMVTKQGLTISAFKMDAQEVDMGLESVVCLSNPWITSSYTDGDYTYDTECDLVPNANNSDCVDECYESVNYTPQSSGNGENDGGTQNPNPTGSAGGSNGGSNGGTSNTTNTTTNCKKTNRIPTRSQFCKSNTGVRKQHNHNRR